MQHTLLKFPNLQFSSRLFVRSACAFLFALACFLPGGSAVAESILNSQEQQIANFMINDPQQQRPTLTLDPTLAQVARQRAADMAHRHYFAHVNPDGVAANYLLRQAGYPLPDWWGTDPQANYVESIAAGDSTAEGAWSRWMGSSGHRTHILGLESFYAEETSYGVGYFYDSESPYKYYWVIITAPPRPAPKLAITSPANAAKVTSPSLNVTGTTSSESATQTVEVSLENANGVGAYSPASGTTSWSATVTNLAIGANTIHVRSRNTSGAVIAEASRAVTLVVTSTLTVTINGEGSVTAAFVGSTPREVGKSYTITATPAAGFLFTGWKGNSDSKSATLNFQMIANMTLQANFAPNPFVAVKGNYNGMFATNEHAGMLKITTNAGGTLTGKLLLDGVCFAFTGRFDTDGAATLNIPRSGKTPLVLDLQLDLAGSTDKITGSISDGTFTADLSTDRAVFDPIANSAPQAGRYTVVVAANASLVGADYPQGDGWAMLTVNAAGCATIAGRLADATPFTRSIYISKDGALPLYVALYGAKGSLAGTLTFQPLDGSDLDGTLNWVKPARPADVFYPNGFTIPSATIGSRYVAPAAGTRVLDFADAVGNSVITLGDGNLDSPISQVMTLTSANKITAAEPNLQKIVIAVNPLTGVISGKFLHPVANVARGVNAVVFQKQNAAFGYFRGTDQSGFVTLTAAPAE